MRAATFRVLFTVALFFILTSIYFIYGLNRQENNEQRVTGLYLPVMTELSAIQLDHARTHLWFEEYLSGDKTINLEGILSSYQKLGTELEELEKKVHAIGNEEMHADFLNLIQTNLQLHDLLNGRLVHNDISMAGTDLDEEFDDVFQRLLRSMESLSQKIRALIESSIETANEEKKMLYRVFVLLVILFLIGMFYYVKFQLHYQKRLKKEVEDKTSELKIAKEKAEESSQLKSAFLMKVSHEIRTPMNAIMGFTDIILGTKLDDAQIKYMGIVKDSTTKLMGIIESILDFSRLHNKQTSLTLVPAGLRQELVPFYESFEALAAKKDLQYELQWDEKISSCLLADLAQLKQVLTALILNAISYTPAKGVVSLSVRVLSSVPPSQRILFSVEDSGIGIADEEIKTIFQSFSQADNSVSREYEGLGLGLNISSLIVEAMGGKLEVQSVKGEGSTFYFDLKFDTCES